MDLRMKASEWMHFMRSLVCPRYIWNLYNQKLKELAEVLIWPRYFWLYDQNYLVTMVTLSLWSTKRYFPHSLLVSIYPSLLLEKGSHVRSQIKILWPLPIQLVSKCHNQSWNMVHLIAFVKYSRLGTSKNIPFKVVDISLWWRLTKSWDL